VAGPIVLTGGGTGGHIFPMQAVAEQLQALGAAPNDLRYVGSRRGPESELLSGPIPLTLLAGRGIRRSLSPSALGANAGAVAGLAWALARSCYELARWRPSVVISFGGYASLPTSLAAVLCRRPLVLVDLDAVPAASHRLLSRFAARRCTALASGDRRAVVTGAPVRDAIAAIDRSPRARLAARDAFSPPLGHERTVVVVMTGSLGAASVNRAVTGLARLWSSRRDVALVHVTGRRDFAAVAAAQPPLAGLDYRVIAFADMVPLWSVCDVALCRAGATTVAELTTLGIAAVLVPLPGAPGDHQTRNARALVEAGAAVLVADERCDEASLAAALDELVDPLRREAMGRAAASLARPGAARAIAEVAMDVGGRR
jgi:UDP-N-acetylglucosamine--N-acetylmuramyl-(pentapeptide) pyrophosphoryl-undecaprenol N-acetylglucosamine transferase